MEQLTITLATTPGDIAKLAKLANEIWHQHFTPIIGEAQVNYMVDQFQSKTCVNGTNQRRIRILYALL